VSSLTADLTSLQLLANKAIQENLETKTALESAAAEYAAAKNKTDESIERYNRLAADFTQILALVKRVKEHNSDSTNQEK